MLFLMDDMEKHLFNPNRIAIDAQFIHRILSIDPNIQGNIIDLPGPGFIRRWSEWEILRGDRKYVGTERNNEIYGQIGRQRDRLAERFVGENLPIEIYRGDFWRRLFRQDKFTFVLFCGTKTLGGLVEQENFLENIQKMIDSSNVTKTFYFMLTFSRRNDNLVKRRRYFNMIRSILGKEEMLVDYGNVKRGQTYMTSILFRID